MEAKNIHLKDVKIKYYYLHWNSLKKIHIIKKYIFLILKYIIILQVYTQIKEILSPLKYAEKLAKIEQIKLKSNEKLQME